MKRLNWLLAGTLLLPITARAQALGVSSPTPEASNAAATEITPLAGHSGFSGISESGRGEAGRGRHERRQKRILVVKRRRMVLRPDADALLRGVNTWGPMRGQKEGFQ